MNSRSKWLYLLVGGLAGGLVLMLLGVLVGTILGKQLGGWQDLALGMLGGMVGSVFGAGIGVYWTGRWLGLHPSVGRVLAGIGLGAVVVMMFAGPTMGAAGSAGGYIVWAMAIGLPALFATLFNAGRGRRAEGGSLGR